MDRKQIVAEYEDSRKKRIQHSPVAHFSNDLATLKHLLAHQIYKSDDPTRLRKLVIIPSNMIKDDLVQFFTRETGNLFSIRFLTLPQLIQHLLKLSLPPHITPRFPNHLSVSLHIEHEIAIALESEDEEFAPLKRYINGESTKLRSLSEEMSHVFLFYGQYGGEALIEWERTPGWQQRIWQNLKSFWDFPCQLLSQPSDLPIEMELHFFSLSSIPKLYRRFIDSLEKSLPIFYYTKSPTDLYWGDLLTESRVAKLDAKWEREGISISERSQFASMNLETNSLLANLGRMGQAFYDHLTEKECIDVYHPPKKTTALSMIQSDIFKMEPPTQPFPTDNSISVHEAPNLMREVEVLLHNLKSIYEEESFSESDVLVMAPDLDRYLPYIEFVFGGDGLFGYRAVDVKSLHPTSTLLAISKFFSLSQSRFEPELIFALFKAPAFLGKSGFDREDIPFFESIIAQIGIRFGYDKADREEILKESGLTANGTWQFGFDRMLDQLPHLDSMIELSKAEKLGEFMGFVEKLHLDFQNIRKVKRDLHDWIERIFTLISDYFTPDSDTHYFLTELNRLSDLSEHVNSLYSYLSIQRILKEIYLGKTSTFSSKRGSRILFSRIQEGVIPNVKLLAVLGLDEESFPRASTFRSINQLKGNPKADLQCEMPEKDRFFFLEALLAPKDHLLLSYVGISENDGKKLNPSLLIRELQTYMSSDRIIKHPPFPFSKSIVQGRHYSVKNFELATAFYDQTATNPIPDSTKSTTIAESDIDIRSLNKLARHPVQFYCNESLGIYYEKTDEEKRHRDKEFVLSYLDKAIYVNASILQDEDKVISDAKENSALPTALFRETALLELHETISEMQGHFNDLSIDRSSFISVSLHKSLPTAKSKSEHTRLLPALEVGNQFVLHGQIDWVTEQGLFVNGLEEFGQIWKHWPSLLILAIVQPDIPTTLLFGKSGTKRNFSIKKPKDALLSYANYYREALKRPSPLMPSCVEAFLKGDEDKFIKKLNAKNLLFTDPYKESVTPDTAYPWKQYFEEACSVLIV